MSGKSLALAAIPLQARRQECDDEEEGELSDIQAPRNLQIVSSSPFRLPDDWLVEERPRLSSVASRRRQIDRYYYEPGTGRMFRSLVSVQRHLMGETRKTKRVKENKNTMQAEARTRGSTSSFRLPNDWILEEKPRKYVPVRDRSQHLGSFYKDAFSETQSPEDGKVTYIEPETGQRFRSLRAVKRYLSENNAFTATPKPLLKHGRKKQGAPGENCCAKAVSKRSKVAEEDGITLKSLKLTVESKKSGSPKKVNLVKDSKASMVNLSSPQTKVKWVLSGFGGFWTPFLNGSKVPESVKQKWSDAFVLYIQDGGTN